LVWNRGGSPRRAINDGPIMDREGVRDCCLLQCSRCRRGERDLLGVGKKKKDKQKPNAFPIKGRKKKINAANREFV